MLLQGEIVVILKDGRKVYNTETAKLILNLPNGFKGHRKKTVNYFLNLKRT